MYHADVQSKNIAIWYVAIGADIRRNHDFIYSAHIFIVSI